MRVLGHDLFALIGAVLAIYLVGMMWYGFVFSELWMSLMGLTEADLGEGMWKMALSPLMPILKALLLALIFHRTGTSGLVAQLKFTALIWLAFPLTTLAYQYVYWPDYPLALFALDGGHVLVSSLAGAAVLAWRKTPKATEIDPQETA
ncbi:DUF1761 domain-containing protein [Woodsholea maritima]|uniref:DUF1761 domain-containing protein n=1 Tax=Woodsholea maritima TaxID=240237 RepID=UPI000365B40E|nr:DUF1761 domain-containing protein [Woodsholea maritima]